MALTNLRTVYGPQFLLEYEKKYSIIDWIDLDVANPLLRTAGDTFQLLRFGDESVTEDHITDWSVGSQYNPSLTYAEPTDTFQELKINRQAYWTRQFPDSKLDVFSPGVVAQMSRLAARAVRYNIEDKVINDMIDHGVVESFLDITGADVTTGGALTEPGSGLLARHVGCEIINVTQSTKATIATVTAANAGTVYPAPAAAWLGTDEIQIAVAKEFDMSSSAAIKAFFRSLKTYFDQIDAPMEGRFICMAPEAFNKLTLVDEFISDLYIGPDRVIRTGDVGMAFGFAIFSSNFHIQQGDMHRVIAGVMVPEAPPYALFVKKQFDIEMLRAPNNFADNMRGRMLYGRGSFGKVQTATTDGTAIPATVTAYGYESNLGLITVVATGV